MRRALRLLAAVVIGCCLVAAVAYIVLVVREIVRDPAPQRGDILGLSIYGSVPLLALGLVACVAGILLCLTDLTLPLPTPPLAGRRVAQGLRAIAAAQFWGGLAAGVVTYGAMGWVIWTTRPTVGIRDIFLWPLYTFGVLGLSCVGGLLWCAVRVAYARPAPLPLPKRDLDAAETQPRLGPVGEQVGDQTVEPARE